MPQYWLGWRRFARLGRTGWLSVSINFIVCIVQCLIPLILWFMMPRVFRDADWLLVSDALTVLEHLSKKCCHSTCYVFPKYFEKLQTFTVSTLQFFAALFQTASLSSSVVIGITSVSFEPSHTHTHTHTHPYPVSNTIITLSSSTCISLYFLRMCSLNPRNISLADFCNAWPQSLNSEISRCPLLFSV